MNQVAEAEAREPVSLVRQLANQAFSRAAGALLLPGNSVHLLKDAQQNYPAWLQAIASARRSIHFENYIIREDDTGRMFADALIAKAREGVRVQLIYDWMGNFGKTSHRISRACRRARSTHSVLSVQDDLRRVRQILRIVFTSSDVNPGSVRSHRLHPVLVIFALLAFGQLFGFFGVLLAMPTSAALVVGFKYLHQEYTDSALYSEPKRVSSFLPRKNRKVRQEAKEWKSERLKGEAVEQLILGLALHPRGSLAESQLSNHG